MGVVRSCKRCAPQDYLRTGLLQCEWWGEGKEKKGWDNEDEAGRREDKLEATVGGSRTVIQMEAWPAGMDGCWD